MVGPVTASSMNHVWSLRYSTARDAGMILTTWALRKKWRYSKVTAWSYEKTRGYGIYEARLDKRRHPTIQSLERWDWLFRTTIAWWKNISRDEFMRSQNAGGQTFHLRIPYFFCSQIGKRYNFQNSIKPCTHEYSLLLKNLLIFHCDNSFVEKERVENPTRRKKQFERWFQGTTKMPKKSSAIDNRLSVRWII